MGNRIRSCQVLRHHALKKRLNFFRGQAPGAWVLVPTRADQPPRDVVAQALAVLSAVAGGQTVSGLVKELARKRRPRRLGLRAARLGCILLEQPLNPVPKRGIDDRRVLTGVALPLVADVFQCAPLTIFRCIDPVQTDQNRSNLNRITVKYGHFARDLNCLEFSAC